MHHKNFGYKPVRKSIAVSVCSVADIEADLNNRKSQPLNESLKTPQVHTRSSTFGSLQDDRSKDFEYNQLLVEYDDENEGALNHHSEL
jgi:hypothetical protein